MAYSNDYDDYDDNDELEDKDEETVDIKSYAAKLLLVLVFCVICCLVVVVVTNWDKLSPEGIEESVRFSGMAKEDFSQDISGTAVLEKNIINTDGGVLYISDTSVVKLDYNGEQIFSSQHSYTNPFVKGNGIYSIAYSVGSGSFKIFGANGELYSGEQGTSITDGDITSAGVYCLVSDKTGYLSALYVYDNDNNFVYSYSFNALYAMSVSLNAEGTMAAVGGVNAIDGRMVSKVFLLDFTKEDPVYTFEYSDQIIYEVDFIEKDRFAVVTDKMVSVADCSNGREHPYIFGSKVLTAYNIGYANAIVLSLADFEDGRECSVVTLNTSGSEVGVFSTGSKIYSVSCRKDKIAVLSADKLYLYNYYGDCFNSWEIGSDAKSVLLPQEKTAYVLGVSEIRKHILDG